MKILIDNGHGVNTAGKRSPDGRLIEGVYARDIARRLAQELEEQGIHYALVTPEKDDVSIRTRVYRANDLHRWSSEGSLLISLHSDAASNTGWSEAKGMSVLVAPNASNNTKKFAHILYNVFAEKGIPVRKYNGNAKPYWTRSLPIIRDTIMPAVLIEMFFHTNREQVDWALSDAGRTALTNALLAAVRQYANG